MFILIIIVVICLALSIGLIAWVESKIRIMDKQLTVLRAKYNRCV